MEPDIVLFPLIAKYTPREPQPSNISYPPLEITRRLFSLIIPTFLFIQEAAHNLL